MLIPAAMCIHIHTHTNSVFESVTVMFLDCKCALKKKNPRSVFVPYFLVYIRKKEEPCREKTKTSSPNFRKNAADAKKNRLSRRAFKDTNRYAIVNVLVSG